MQFGTQISTLTGVQKPVASNITYTYYESIWFLESAASCPSNIRRRVSVDQS